MDPALALQILQWVAIIVVYLGFAAVLRETRLLRAQVSRLQLQLAAGEPGAADAPGGVESLPAHLTDGRDGIVVAADTTCPSCARVLDRLTERRDALRLPVTVLTWEPEEAWSGLGRDLHIVRDADAWSELAHLAPPVLLRVAAGGRVQRLHLPASADDVDATLTSWGALAHENAAERDRS